MSLKKQFNIRIYGRVQGVGFRYTAQRMANSLGLKGWVENRPDGSVFAVIQGSGEHCRTFIDWCRGSPGYSHVDRIHVEEREPGEPGPFHIKR